LAAGGFVAEAEELDLALAVCVFQPSVFYEFSAGSGEVWGGDSYAFG
jgi:hypothetical protein